MFEYFISPAKADLLPTNGRICPPQPSPWLRALSSENIYMYIKKFDYYVARSHGTIVRCLIVGGIGATGQIDGEVAAKQEVT